ncbi:hypothetical protein RQP55_03330 [Novosphingobium sp. APW14]|jgi:hypothetical protein|uniref:hypothetical protein n=1 Tax=Novosphingobium sp. APW14 TaxID=3077237 RepID=UPI0028DFC930|nr:hypothetical protein [Novosphingobium sp. APW14]MDT9012463.1 hypothetical protein [Novosphingobium sp. APW14]
MPFHRLLALAAMAGLAVSGCTASRYQISDALQRYGLSENQSSCAAEFLRGHLSTSQVSRLTRAARYYDRDGPLTFGDLIRVAGRIDDREVLFQVGAAALACRIAADIPLPRF